MIAADNLNFPRRKIIANIINPAEHILMFVNSNGDFEEWLKKSCADAPELAHKIPASPTKINAKFFFKTITQLISEEW